MKTARVTGVREVEIVSVPEPDPLEDWVKVKIEAAPMCTEYKAWEAGRSTLMGHEAAGKVVETANAENVAVGDRVVVMPQYPCGSCELCRNGDYIHCEHNHDYTSFTGQDSGQETMAQYMLKQAWMLVPIPDHLSYAHAAMACCGVGPTFGANERMNVGERDSVLISGGGPVGLGGVITTTHRGARVIVSEPTEYRADLARELGADVVVNPLETDESELASLTDGVGVDKAIECSGIPSAQEFAIRALTRRGEMTFVGEGGGFELQVSKHVLRKGISLHGQWHYNRELASRVMDTIDANQQKLNTFITHEFPLREIGDAFALQSEKRTGKVVLHPWA